MRGWYRKWSDHDGEGNSDNDGEGNSDSDSNNSGEVTVLMVVTDTAN